MSRDQKKAFEALLKKHLSDNLRAGKIQTECPDENVVSAYLEGILTQDLQADFEEHASRCVRCQEELSLLLKSPDMAAVSLSKPSPVKADKSSWWTTFQASLAWLSNLGLKPVLAVLAVTLISGYVGVELFQRESRQRESAATEVAQPIPQVRSGVEKDERSNSAQERDQRQAKPAAPEVVTDRVTAKQEGYLNTAETAGRAAESVAPPNDMRSKDANQEQSLRGVYSPAPVESSGADRKVQLGGRSDAPARQRVVAGLPAAPSPDPSLSVAKEQSVDEANAQEPLSAGKKDVSATRAVAANQPTLVSVQPSTNEQAQAKTDVKAKQASIERKLSRHEPRASSLGALGKVRAEVSAPPKEEAGAVPLADKEQRQVRVAGKVFELRNNVWTDLSIEKREDREVDITIDRHSADYLEQIKPLSAYKSVLSRDEDCLIEHQGKIYHIKNSRQAAPAVDSKC